jgi:RNA polymerase subunit RPABC4/transcription elongation factor Spt4
MNQKECPSCAMDVDSNAEKCPICGYEFPQRKTINSKFIIAVMLGAFIYILYKITFG